MLHHHDSTKKQIIGRKFLSAERLNSHEIRIICEDGSFDVGVQGDCCSSSVFYDLIVPEKCVGEEILDVFGKYDDSYNKIIREPILSEEEVHKMGWPDSKYGFDSASIWDVILKTKSGEILLRHANDSNGYYDGDTYYRFN
jgi:hypothetical protein